MHVSSRGLAKVRSGERRYVSRRKGACIEKACWKLVRKEYKGKYHSLIPTIRDRVVQQALKNVIEPIFEAEFLDSSLGYRPEKSAKQAIERIEAIRDKGHEWVVDADIQAFFDMVNSEAFLVKLF